MHLYVSDEDVQVWEEAEEYAKLMHLSASKLVPLALRYFMDNVVAIGPRGLIEKEKKDG